MNVPKLRFKEFDGEWEESNLGEVVKVLDGDRGKNYPSGNDFSTQGHTLFLSAANVTKKGFSFDERQYITQNKSDSLGNGKLEEDDIVLTSRGSLGHIAWYNCNVKKNIPFARINSGMLILRSNKNISPRYISQFLVSPIGKRKIDVISFGSAQPQLTKKDIQKYKLFMPKFVEQQKIGFFFQQIDKKIQLQQEKIDLLKEQKKGFMQKIFSQELRFKDEDEQDFPEWIRTTIGDCFENYGGTALEKYTKNDGKYKFISIGSYNENGRYNDQNLRIDLNEKTRDKLLNKNELVMVLNDKTAAGNIIGRVLLINENNKYIYNQRSERLICKEIIIASYAWHFLNSDYFRRNIISMAQGGTQIYVNFSAVSKLTISLPSLNEQDIIISFLDKLQALVDHEEEKVKLLTLQKQALMQQMFI